MSEKNRVERHLRRLYEGVRPSAASDDAVIGRVSELRRDGRAGAPGRPVAVTRRAVLAGAAGCAVMAGLALGLPLAARGERDRFGLVIAEAAEDGRSVTVEATSDGLMPLEGSYGSYLCLSLGLDVTGANLRSVTYRVADSPVATVDRPSVHEGVSEYPEVSLAVWKRDAAGGSPGAASEPAELVLSYAPDGGEGTLDGDGLPALSVDNREAYWASDETLTLLGEWLDLQQRPIPNEEYRWHEGESDEDHRGRIEELDARGRAELEAREPQIEAAREAYLESFRAHAATPADFLAWERSLYVSAFTCAAGSLAAARLEAAAAFAGGGTQTRRYRITIVDGCEQVLSDRFDALLAIDDDFSQCLEEELPWHEYPTPTDEQVAADPRLSAPIFQIEDVTEA